MAKPGPPVHLAQLLSEAVSLHQQSRLDEAETLYNRVLKLDRGHFDALHLLGMLQHQRGKSAEAHRLIAAALKIHPRSPDALSNLARVLHALKRDDEALQILDRALAYAPDHIDALNSRGIILLDRKRAADARVSFDAVLARAPDHLQARVNRANALAALGRFDDAMADYDAALRLAPRHPLVLFNRGNALREQNRDAEAIAEYDQVLAAMPQHAGAWQNRGLALAAQNRHADAVASYDQALALQPEHADAHFNAALSLLTIGDYRRGFAEYEWRGKRTGMSAKPRFGVPPWRGESPLAGKTILLHAEQGLGDTVQFARYAPLLARAGAQVMLEAQPELKELLSRLDGISAVIARGDKLPSFDLHCPLASLPLAMKTEIATIPAQFPYLKTSEQRIVRWRARLEAVPSPRVALAWSGRATHANDRNRSIALAQLEPLIARPEFRFLSIQRELRAADAERLSGDPRIMHVGEELADFADTAAVLSLADLVISVDTSVAHVAGALGRPTLVLLPFQPDWRWTLDLTHSPWYPAARLFRQERPGDWSGVIERAQSALNTIIR
jgi:tetratricopeptide (TPR) repeat protein